MKTSQNQIERQIFENKVDPNEPYKTLKEQLGDVLSRNHHAMMYTGDLIESNMEVICGEVRLYTLFIKYFLLNFMSDDIIA